MSNKFNWNDEENEEFRDIPDEVNNEQAPPAEVQMPRTNMTREQLIAQARGQADPVAEVAEQYQEIGSGDDQEEDYSEVLSDARLRLEQGRLYELVMNSDLFAESDADERAVRSVQRQIKKFAKEQMEVMLGMRQTTAAAPPMVSSPFNELEVMLLKSLASKMSGGKTEEEQPEQYVAPTAPAPRKAAIKPIGSGKTQQKPPQPLSKGPKTPIQRKAAEKPSPEELLGLPPEPEAPIGKPLAKMTEEEKQQRSQRIAERQKALKAKPPVSALPMPTPDQETMLATIRATEADKQGTVSAIMALMNAQKLS